MFAARTVGGFMRCIWVILEGHVVGGHGELIELAVFHQPAREYEPALTDSTLEVFRSTEEARSKRYESLHFTWAQYTVGQGIRTLSR